MASYPAARPAGRFETYSWLFMRVSGIVLLCMAVFHLLLMHYAIGVENLNFEVVAARWQSPWWRLYDFFLLAFALTHGMNGARILMDEYMRASGWRLFLKTVLSLLYFTLVVMGAWVIVTFN
ncbi:MAG: succinate dehydrogenase [Gemmatimonadota bacterium]|nr:MAG: succinate dehydrogenase [Gemmatimonadota bacterium]